MADDVPLRYLYPVASPAEVDALRAELDRQKSLVLEVTSERHKITEWAEELRNAGRDWSIKANAAVAENTTLRAERDAMEQQMLHEHQAAVDQFGIAEALRARVAELEGVLREIVDDQWSGAQVPRDIASDALKGAKP